MGRGGLDKAAVIEAAAGIADREGLGGVTMARLAAALNIRPPSLYSHFDSLGDVEDGLTLRGLEGLLTVTRDAAVGLSGWKAVEAVARSHRRFGLAHPGLYAATLRHVGDRHPAIRDGASACLRLVLTALLEFDLGSDATLHVARGMHAAIRGFVALELGGGFGLPIDVEESFEVLLSILKGGIAGLPVDRKASGDID